MIIGLLGTDFLSHNRGCGALGYSAIEILKILSEERREELVINAFVYNLSGLSEHQDNSVTINYVLFQPKSLSFWKKAKKIFNQCDFVWDFTGGDSFSDIYGMKRFCLNSALKEVAIRSKTKFIMAPQTIGPFKNRFALLWARHLLRKSDTCFVRDTMSEGYVKDTFGVNPVVTTDVAFFLPYERIESKNNKIRLGINPSGLLWNGTKEFCANKHISVDYKEYIRGILKELCKDNRYEIYLIPHVFSNVIDFEENDLNACEEIAKEFPEIRILREFNTPMEAKSVISSMNIFTGARMHATIASFSTGVATIPFSYSRKFEGLFKDFEYPYIVSATKMKTSEAIGATIQWIKDYEKLLEKMKNAKPLVDEKKANLLRELRQNLLGNDCGRISE